MAQVSTTGASVSDMASVDDFYFSALFDETQTAIFPISDSKYAEELQLQEALFSSSQTTTITPSFPSSSSSSLSASSSSFLLSSSSPPSITVQQFLKMDDHDSAQEPGESSQICCEICAERKPTDEILRSEGCAHSFCADCIAKHVAIKVGEKNSSVATAAAIACPGLDCGGVHELELEALRPVLPREVVERWDEALCEALVMASGKFYCPYRDCSAVMVREAAEAEAEEEVVESECPICHRLFCARCGVRWHSGIGCEEYQRLNDDERASEDLMVREMAKENKWKRCPRCQYYVERIDGCLHISCRLVNGYL